MLDNLRASREALRPWARGGMKVAAVLPRTVRSVFVLQSVGRYRFEKLPQNRTPARYSGRSMNRVDDPSGAVDDCRARLKPMLDFVFPVSADMERVSVGDTHPVVRRGC